MDEVTEAKLLADVKSVSDSLKKVDAILKANRLGVNVKMVFVCGDSGLLYPSDYLRNWGKPYGIGLGPHPVSESLQSEYEVDPPMITSATKSLDQIMHPLRSSCAQMDCLLVDVDNPQYAFAVIAAMDPDYELRAPILRAKQLANPRSRLARGGSVVSAAWSKQKTGGF